MSYKIVRFFADGACHEEVIRTGLTLEEAQAWCNDPKTQRNGHWFDGYREE